MPSQSPLTSVAGRTGLLIGITASTVTRAEVEHAVLKDNAKRKTKAPCYAEGKRFGSVVKAAEYLYANRPALWVFSKSGVAGDEFRVMSNLAARVRRLCDGDKTPGYYWAK